MTVERSETKFFGALWCVSGACRSEAACSAPLTFSVGQLYDMKHGRFNLALSEVEEQMAVHCKLYILLARTGLCRRSFRRLYHRSYHWCVHLVRFIRLSLANVSQQQRETAGCWVLEVVWCPRLLGA